MRRLLFVVLVLAGCYSAYWMIGRAGLNSGVDRAVEAAAARGVKITWADRSLHGFPSRFDQSFTDLRVTTPQMNLQVPLLQSFMLSYSPNRVILFGPGPYQISRGGLEVTVTSDDLRASAAVAPHPNLPLQDVTLEGRALTLSLLGQDHRAGRLLAALRSASPPEARYQAFAELNDLVLDPALVPQPEPGALPDQISQLVLDAALVLDRPLDRHLTGPVQLRQLELSDLRLRWGDSSLALRGDLQFDSAGLATGQLTLRADKWEPLFATLAPRSGLAPEALQTYRTMLSTFAGGPDQPLDIAVNIDRGRMRLGPFTLGQLPALASYRQ